MRTFLWKTFVCLALFPSLVLSGCSRKPAHRSIKVDANVEAVVDGNNALAFDLFSKLRASEGNIIFSPYSISSALGMSYAGADGDTATEMAKVLGVTIDDADYHKSQGQLLTQFDTKDSARAFELNVANRLWGQEGHPFLEEFKQVLLTDYNAEMESVDFAKSDAARDAINTWVEDATENKIQDIIPPDLLSENTRLVLVNAIYFKGTWETQFKESRTEPGQFYRTPERTVKVPMMSQYHNEFPYALVEYDGKKELRILEMPYQSKELSMIFILPEEKDGLADLEAALSTKALEEWIEAMREVELPVMIPKFKMEYSAEINSTLSALGMPLAFSMDDANFKKMDGTEELFLAAVLHKAFIEVNEEGTEAAAATAAASEVKSAAPPKGPEFYADHPFLFLIRDNHTKSILFMGRLANPAEAE